MTGDCNMHGSMRYKPHKGRIDHWEKHEVEGKYFFTGIFKDHPKFKGNWGHTSMVVAQNENEVETLNSRYTLGNPKPVGYRYI